MKRIMYGWIRKKKFHFWVAKLKTMCNEFRKTNASVGICVENLLKVMVQCKAWE